MLCFSIIKASGASGSEQSHSNLLLCRYKPFLIAEADANPGSGGNEAAERSLQAYLLGSNDRKQTIDRTTPIFVDEASKVFCMLPGNQVCHEGL